MTRYRVSKTSADGKHRIVSDKIFDTKDAARKFVVVTNNYFPGANARVVKDSERVRRMIP